MVPIGPNDVLQIVLFQKQGGGWIAVGCALLGGLIQWLRMPLLQCPGVYETNFTGERVCATAKTVDPIALGTILFAAFIGGCVGVVIALILIRWFGVSHDQIGADPDA